MKQINNYIIEKLVINKDSEESNEFIDSLIELYDLDPTDDKDFIEALYIAFNDCEFNPKYIFIEKRDQRNLNTSAIKYKLYERNYTNMIWLSGAIFLYRNNGIYIRKAKDVNRIAISSYKTAYEVIIQDKDKFRYR